METQLLVYNAACICSQGWGCEEECTNPRVEMMGTSGLLASPLDPLEAELARLK
jgi:hypothetical protein